MVVDRALIGQAYWPITVFRYYEQRQAGRLLMITGFCSSVAHDHPELLIDPRILQLL